MNSIRYAARLLRKSPGFALVVILTLGLGIGANTAVFSFANAFLLNPVSLPELDRLVMLLERRPGRSAADWNLVSPGNFFDWQRQSSSFQSFTGYRMLDANLTGDGEAEKLQAAIVLPNFFEMLKARPLVGRTFAPDEGQPGRDQVVVLTHAVWQRDFGADLKIPGRAIRLNGKTYTVLGVMQKDFAFPIAVQLWMPLAMDPKDTTSRVSHSLAVIARLKPNASVPGATAEMITIGKRLEAAYPVTNKGWAVLVQPVREFVSGYYTRHYTFMLMGAVIFVLLIACANIANLQFARASGRTKEIAVRTALGASRLRLVAQLLVESLMLSLCGAVVGLLFGAWGIHLVRVNMPAEVSRYIAGWEHVRLDAFVLVWTMLTSVLAGIVSGIVPALQSTRAGLSDTLKESGRSTSAGRKSLRLRNLLVVGEVALALVLLVGAGLMVKGARALIGANSQYRPESLLTLSFTLPETKYSEKFQRMAFDANVLERVSSIPLVQGAALSNGLPSAYGGLNYFEVEGQPAAETSEVRTATGLVISPNYLRVLGAPLLEGREFTDSDGADAMQVAIVNKVLAHRYWPGRSAIGRRVRYGRGDSSNPWMTVVGVAADIKYDWGEREIAPAIYRPYRQAPGRFSYLLVRAPGDPLGVAGAIRREIAAVDKELPLFEIATLERVITNSVLGISYVAVMLAVTGSIALLLACVGVFGVMAYSVSERTHEIGIRMALGARQADVLGLIALRGLLLTSTGLVIGLIGSVALARLLSNLIFGVSATDVATFSGVSALLLALSMAACYTPVRRAMRVDPIQALRQE